MDGRNEPVANATTYAEKDQRKAIPMKALWRLGVGTGRGSETSPRMMLMPGDS